MLEEEELVEVRRCLQSITRDSLADLQDRAGRLLKVLPVPPPKQPPAAAADTADDMQDAAPES